MKSITGDILLVGISYDKKHKEHKIEMAYEEAFTYLEKKGFKERVQVFDVSSATVELAALAVGTEPARIAKS